jgi:signal transduction histidine kinase
MPSLPSLYASAVPLELIFRNLLGNAIKHHDCATGHITITGQEAESFVEFAVSDDGPGIPRAYHDRIFQMFQTLRPRDEVEGSGMGLALVKKTLEVHGEAIRVESAPGRGTTFRFIWPKAAPVQQECSTPAAPLPGVWRIEQLGAHNAARGPATRTSPPPVRRGQ